MKTSISHKSWAFLLPEMYNKKKRALLLYPSHKFSFWRSMVDPVESKRDDISKFHAWRLVWKYEQKWFVSCSFSQWSGNGSHCIIPSSGVEGTTTTRDTLTRRTMTVRLEQQLHFSILLNSHDHYSCFSASASLCLSWNLRWKLFSVVFD